MIAGIVLLLAGHSGRTAAPSASVQEGKESGSDGRCSVPGCSICCLGWLQLAQASAPAFVVPDCAAGSMSVAGLWHSCVASCNGGSAGSAMFDVAVGSDIRRHVSGSRCSTLCVGCIRLHAKVVVECVVNRGL